MEDSVLGREGLRSGLCAYALFLTFEWFRCRSCEKMLLSCPSAAIVSKCCCRIHAAVVSKYCCRIQMLLPYPSVVAVSKCCCRTQERSIPRKKYGEKRRG